MPPELRLVVSAQPGVPLPVTFADLFDHLGTEALCYSAAARVLSGREVAIEGFLSRAHGPHAAISLVDQPGLCPDCAPVPAAVIALPGARPVPHAGEEPCVRVVGRLGYGFRIESGVASMLRIEQPSLQAVAS